MRKLMTQLAPGLLLVFSLTAMAFGQNADAEAKADQIIKQARAAIGDESKLKALQSLSATASARQSFGERQFESEVEVEILMPDKIKRTTTNQFMTNTLAINGTDLWNDRVMAVGGPGGGGPGGGPGGGGGMRGGFGGGGGGGNSPMAAYFQQQQRRELLQLTLGWLLITPSSLSMKYSYVGEAQGPNGKVDVIDGATSDGIKTRLYIDQQSHRLVGLSYKGKQLFRGPMGRGPGGPGAGRQEGGQRPPQANAEGGGGQGQRPQLSEEEREKRRKEAMEAFEKAPEVDYRWAFAEYKSVNGINLPHRLTKSEGGTPNEEWEITKFKINPKLSADKFVKKEKEKNP